MPVVVYIPLSNSDWMTVVSAEDAASVMSHKWMLIHRKARDYVSRTTDGLLLHRFILGPADGQIVDHRNGYALDNTRPNLRIATPTENARNMHARYGRSVFRGVSRAGKGWMARITFRKETRYIGYFQSEVEAAKAYDAQAISLFGKGAVLNERLLEQLP